jgi:hypothetical protein
LREGVGRSKLAPMSLVENEPDPNIRIEKPEIKEGI